MTYSCSAYTHLLSILLLIDIHFKKNVIMHSFLINFLIGLENLDIHDQQVPFHCTSQTNEL